MTTSYQVALICRDSNGSPAFFPAVVTCDSSKRSEQEFDDAVRDAAEAKGYEIPQNPILCDLNDTLGEILDYGIDWEDEAQKISI